MACPAIFIHDPNHDPNHDPKLIDELTQEPHVCGSTCFQYTLYPSFPLFWQLPVHNEIVHNIDIAVIDWMMYTEVLGCFLF